MRQTETHTLGDVKLTITQHPALEASALLVLLGTVASPALSALDFADLEGSEDIAALLPAVTALFHGLSQHESEALFTQIFKHTIAEYERGPRRVSQSLASKEVINETFSGKLLDMYKAALLVLKANFQATFAAGVSGLADRIAPGLETLKASL